MADRKKSIRKRKESDAKEVTNKEDEISKLEYDVAKYLRSTLPKKTTTLLRDKVDYFIASKAIDALLDSKWAVKQNNEADALFTTRESVVDFLNQMLSHQLFHRASKIVIKEKKKKETNLDADADEENFKKKDKKKLDDDDKKEKKKEKKKIKLDIHMEQFVIDANEPYVWLYEPVSVKSWIFGFFLVIGVILICLFPLWPSVARDGVYYVSLAAAFFIVFIIGLAIIKGVLFLIIWTVTFGKHHFWLLPNLTEDVGFFASFVPLYEHRTKDQILEESENKKTKKSKSLKESKKKSKNQDKEYIEKNKDDSASDEKISRYDKDEDDNKQDGSDFSENDSAKNNGFEIVDDKELPPILNLNL